MKNIEDTNTYHDILHFVMNNSPEVIARNWTAELIREYNRGTLDVLNGTDTKTVIDD